MATVNTAKCVQINISHNIDPELAKEPLCVEDTFSALHAPRAKLEASTLNQISGTSGLLKLPYEVMQLVAFELVDANQDRYCTKNIHRDLSSIGYTCRRMSVIVIPAFYHSIKFYKYDTLERIELLWRTLGAHRNLGEYVRTLCLTQAIEWDWTSLLSLLPNLQQLTIPSGVAVVLQSAKLPLLSSLSYTSTSYDPLVGFPWEVLFQPCMRHWRYCFPYYCSTDEWLLRPLLLPPKCVARSSPVTHIELIMRTHASANFLNELLTWPKELFSFSFESGLDTINMVEISSAIAMHRASLKHFRLPWLPHDSLHSLESLDLKSFERLENLELEWEGVHQFPPTMVAQCLPPSLFELALLYTPSHGDPSCLNARDQEWLIELANTLKTETSSLQSLKLSKHRVRRTVDDTATKAVEHAWNEVGVIVVWIE
ncbi:hypothetical protein MMC27_008585 [Xylographa pallens]|nr:hypothetical protein [Xylographa pallens]